MACGVVPLTMSALEDCLTIIRVPVGYSLRAGLNLRMRFALPRTSRRKCRTAQWWGALGWQLEGARVPKGRVPGATALLLNIYGRFHAQVTALGRALAEKKQPRRVAPLDVVVRLYKLLHGFVLVNMVDNRLFPRVTHRGSDPAQGE